MEPITIRLQPNTKESLEGEADERGMSLSEYVRELVSTAREYDAVGGDEADTAALRDRVAELEDTVDTLRAERNEAREEVSNLEGRLEEVRARLEDKDDRIEHLEGQIQVKDGRLDELEKRTAAANKKAELQPREPRGVLDRLRGVFGRGGDNDE